MADFPWNEMREACNAVLVRVKPSKSLIFIRDEIRGITLEIDQRKIATRLLKMCDEYEAMKRRAYPFGREQ